MLRSDSLNAELRWRDIGAARMLAGATGRHPAGVTGMRSPRGAACLTRSGAARGRRRQRAGGLGRGEVGRRRRSARRAAGGDAGQAGFGRRARNEAQGPRRRKNPFPNKIFKEFLNTIFQILF